MQHKSFRQSVVLVVAMTWSLATPAIADVEAAADTPPEEASKGMTLPGFEWSLPCESKLDSSGQRRSAITSGTRLTGSVTQWNIDGDFGALVNTLLDGALGSDPKNVHLNRAVGHYTRSSSTFLSDAKDAANYIVPFRGFAPSSEAADVILDEKIKVKDRASAEYAKQRMIDDLHPKLVAKTMQLAMAVGTKDPVEREELVPKAVASLEEVVGKERAQLALAKLEEWGKLQLPDSAYKASGNWDVEAYQTKIKLVTKLAMDGDPVMQQIVNSLKKYNHKSSLSRGAGKVVPAALNVASWVAPGLLIPAALQLVNAGYIMATGGPEENKLVKELYLDRRVESRYRTVNDEAELALSQYQNAQNLHNPALMVCCEAVLTQLVGTENISSVIGRTLLSHQATDPNSMTATSQTQAMQ